MRCLRWAVLLVMSLCVGGLVAETGNGVDAETLKNVDPLRSDVADFLDDDLGSVLVQGLSAFRRGDYPQAARCFLYLLRRDSNNPELMFQLAECYARWGYADKAARFLRHAVNAGFGPLQRVVESGALAAMRNVPSLRPQRSAVLEHLRQAGKSEFVKSCRLEPIQVHLPENYDPGRTYTLMIGLHGNGDNSANFARIHRHFGRQNFIFAVPAGSYQKFISTLVPGERLSWELETLDKEMWQRADPLVVENILEVQRYLSAKYRIGDTYLLGFSQGAAYAWATAIRHSERFRGVICFAGILPPADKPWSLFSSDHLRAAAPRLRAFVAHGSRDEAIGVTQSEKAVQQLSGLGFIVEFQAFKGGHELPPAMLKKAARWMMNPPAGTRDDS